MERSENDLYGTKSNITILRRIWRAHFATSGKVRNLRQNLSDTCHRVTNLLVRVVGASPPFNPCFASYILLVLTEVFGNPTANLPCHDNNFGRLWG